MNAITKLFQSNRTQAVRLPRDVAFPSSVREVRILREGRRRILVPADAVWDDFFEAGGSEDFPPDRAQPEAQTREPF